MSTPHDPIVVSLRENRSDQLEFTSLLVRGLELHLRLSRTVFVYSYLLQIPMNAKEQDSRSDQPNQSLNSSNITNQKSKVKARKEMKQ